ncbi:MAG: MFS transporter [Desulfobacteraceae bacterium]|nr:MFS transporter [Desulfobacteraceae bacterium]
MVKSIKDTLIALFSIKKLILSFMLLIIIATGFNTFLSTLAFQSFHVNSIISQYHVVGNVLKKKIELSLHFGKKIENFFGMEALLRTNLKYLTNLDSELNTASDVHILIANSTGNILYRTLKEGTSFTVSEEVIEHFIEHSKTDWDKKDHFKEGNYHYIIFPIYNWDSTLAAFQIISFPHTMISKNLVTLIKNNLKAWCRVLAASFAILILLFYVILKQSRDETATSNQNLSIFRQKRFSYTLFLIIALFQILFSFSQIQKFSISYLNVNRDKAHALNLFMKDQIENLLKKGITLKNLNKTEHFLAKMMTDIPEFSHIMISDKDGSILYYADHLAKYYYKDQEIQSLKPDMPVKYLNKKVLMDKEGKKAGSISILISKKALNTFKKKIFLDAATIVLISIFFCVEIMILFFIELKKKSYPAFTGRHVSTRIIRPVAFLYFFAIDIVVSFIPLYMKDLYGSLPDFIISKNMSLGLPVTVQMVFTAVSILIVGAWCDKKGWQQPFLLGLLFSALGFFAAFLAKSPIIFLVSLATTGFGYGLSYISAQNFVTTNSAPEKKAQGLAEYYAGCMAGSLCGIATGGMLAEQIGFANVFFIGFIILLGVFGWSFFFMKPYFIFPKKSFTAKHTAQQVSWINFFFDRQILILIFLNIVPASIIIVGFLNFFIPVYLEANQISQADIGRIFIVFGICLIYVSPFITKRVNIKKHSINYIVIGGVLSSMALLSFSYISGYAAAMISILFLGLGASFNAIRNAYALNLPVSEQIGEGRVTSLIFFYARLGQALGPIVFAWFIVAGNESGGVVKIGILFLLMTIVFLLYNSFRAKESVNKNGKQT